VQRTRQRFVEGGLDRALNEDPRPGARKRLDEKGEALLETLAKSEPPEGRKRSTPATVGRPVGGVEGGGKHLV
jgi:hypothetical protein